MRLAGIQIYLNWTPALVPFRVFAGVTTAAASYPIKKDGDFFCLCVYGKIIIQYITACYSRSRDSIHLCHAGLDPASRKIKLVPGTRAFQCIRRDDD